MRRNHEIAQLKADSRLDELVREHGIALRLRESGDLIGLCPFHSGSSPTLAVSTEINFFQCFGCGAKGSPIDWVMETKGFGLGDAIAFLRARLHRLDSFS